MSQFSLSAVPSEASGAVPPSDETSFVTNVVELDARAAVQHQRQIRNALSAKTLYTGLYSGSHAGKIWQLAKAHLAEDVCLSPRWTRN
jgi:hypothetical protein